jgi:hypothetical protein
MASEEEIQAAAKRTYERHVERELKKGATDLQAYRRAQERADKYADMRRLGG